MDHLPPYPNFYPYIPNEVKHRKRTSTAQLKVLENIFKTDTKPNATLRKKLAQDLGMTPRGVQVWFQNRRAKEKNRANKAAEVTKRQPGGFPTSPVPVDASSPPELGSSSEDASVEQANASASGNAQAQSLSPTWNVSPAPTPASSDSRSVQLPCADLYPLRRGSLPADLYLQPSPSYPSPLSDHASNEFARRCSVDTSLQMLARNPYATLASRRTAAMHQMASLASRFQQHQQRPSASFEMGHVSMDPHAMYYSYETSSSSSQDSSSFSHSSSPHSVYGTLPDAAHSYTAPSRVVPPTIPGPLPTEGFSFGNATTTAHDNVYNSSSNNTTLAGDFTDGDDTALPSYEALSRFGSITSTATSDSGAYFSECGDDAYASRRGSINDLMSTMSFRHSNGVVTNEDSSVPSPGGSRDGSDRTTHYSSPTPTISPPSTSPVVANVEQPLGYPTSTYMEGGIDPHSTAMVQAVYTATAQSHAGSAALLDLRYPSEYPQLPSTGHYQGPNACYPGSGALTGAYPPIQATVQGEYCQVVQVPTYAGGYPTDKPSFV